MENLLQVLKLDATLFPQFLIFLVAYIALTELVFKPYMKAYNQRKNATVGNQEVAEQLALETQDINFKYETKAKELNSQIRAIFDSARKDATKLQEEVLYKAREEAEEYVKKNREEIRESAAKAREELKKHAPEISKIVASRILGKEVQ